MIAPGKYSAWFKTPIGEGAGVVELHADGTLSGGDMTFSYRRNWSQEDGRIKASYSARRVEPGPPGVFAIDEVDLVVSGSLQADGSLAGAGFAKQSPGLKLEVVLMPMRDDRAQ